MLAMERSAHIWGQGGDLCWRRGEARACYLQASSFAEWIAGRPAWEAAGAVAKTIAQLASRAHSIGAAEGTRRERRPTPPRAARLDGQD